MTVPVLLARQRAARRGVYPRRVEKTKRKKTNQKTSHKSKAGKLKCVVIKVNVQRTCTIQFSVDLKASTRLDGQ
jgi:hypothetical protein